MNETLNWLAEQCKNNLLAEKWLLCGDLRSGQSWKDRLNLSGTATVNLHSKSIRALALSLMSPSIAAEELIYLNSDGTTALVHDLLIEAQRGKTLRYFAGVLFTESLAKLLSRSFRDLRLANLPADLISATAFYSLDKAADVQRLYKTYCRALDDRSLIDYAGCLQKALEEMVSGAIRFPDELMILIPTELQLTFAEDCFLRKLGECIQIKRLEKPAFNSDAVRSRLAEVAKQLPGSIEYLAGYGEANEVRAVVQRVLGSDGHKSTYFDQVELQVTDPSTYGPLLYESLSAWMARRDLGEPPVTFADGLACVYSRPGRALRAWLRWIRTDCVQAKVVQMIREGLLRRPKTADEIGYARLASQLRGLAIGFRAERYLPSLKSAIDQAKQLQQEFLNRREEDDTYDDEFPRDFGLPMLEALHAMLEPLLRYAPSEGDTAKEVLRKAKNFLLNCARSDDKLDRLARNKLLDDIDGRLASLEYTQASSTAVLTWLEELPVESCILASGPQPGCLHVASLYSDGVSGRQQVFVMGLDASRFPKATAVDPVLLDYERARISPALQTSSQSAQLQEQALLKKLDQIMEVGHVQLRFSFSTRNLIEGRAQSPSAGLVEIFRVTENCPQAHVEELLAHIGPPATFSSEKADQWLDSSESFLASLLTDPDESRCWDRVEWMHSHFRDQAIAFENRAATEFSNHDGWVPDAGSELTPSNATRQVSPSRLETYGTCPRRFLFKYGLQVSPPDEWIVDSQRWLDPLLFGKLVHSLFEKFLRSLTAKKQIPNLDRDLPQLLELLKQEIQIYQAEVPIPNEDAFQQQCELLEDTCEIFLRKEQEYCERNEAVPWVLESFIGLKDEPKSPIDSTEPVSLSLPDGRLLRIGGRIDRVDRSLKGGSEQYMIWDYKSGSSYGFSQSDPFKQGRKLQSYLYVGMLRHRLASIGYGSDAATGFGYFFPSPKTEGLRMQWTAAELKQGDGILQHIYDAITAGIFPATTDANDCQHCQFSEVCKEPALVAQESLHKSLEPQNREKLNAWRKLRSLDAAETDQ